jgi:hypothetical protein
MAKANPEGHTDRASLLRTVVEEMPKHTRQLVLQLTSDPQYAKSAFALKRKPRRDSEPRP